MRYLGGEGAWDHLNSCLHHAPNWTCAHNRVLRALESICNDAGFVTNHKRVLTSEGNRRADLEIRKIRVASKPICWWTSILKASSATPTTRATS